MEINLITNNTRSLEKSFNLKKYKYDINLPIFKINFLKNFLLFSIFSIY